MPETTAPQPLKGLRVIEFTHMVMGPTCGMVLADMGAAARASWSRHFTWDTIARYYEAVLRGAPVAVGATLPG